MSPVQLAIQNLTITAPRCVGPALVHDANLAIPRGGSLCVIGETGSGKSLIAQAVMGLLPASLRATGHIWITGRAPLNPQDTKALRALWSDVTSIIPQEPGTAFDPLVRVGAQLGGNVRHTPARVEDALASVELPASTMDAYPFQLSGGMAHRVLIAHATLSDASLVIADEPTKGLDGPRIAQVTALLRQSRDSGKTLLVITHDLSVARGLGGMVAVMRDGVIVESGEAAQVLDRPSHAYTQAWLAADPANWPACETCLHADDIVLAAHGLTVGYGTAKPLFRDLDLHVRKAEVLAIVGPSGVGKSTLGNVLLGLLQPHSGEVSWAGCDPYRDPAGARRLRRLYQKLHQDPTTVFTPHRTIGAQLRDVMAEEASGDAARLLILLERLKLRPDLQKRRVGEVSGGEAQRLALARLLLMNPALIVADEPTSRLDPIVQQQTMLLLRDIVVQDGLALVLISHQKDVVKAVADEVVELKAQ
jgi:peptide/nickel transport system ATP-binding protein